MDILVEFAKVISIPKNNLIMRQAGRFALIAILKLILLLVKLIMQASHTISYNLTKIYAQNPTMHNGCQEFCDEIEKNWTKAAFEWSSEFYDNCRAVVVEEVAFI